LLSKTPCEEILWKTACVEGQSHIFAQVIPFTTDIVAAIVAIIIKILKPTRWKKCLMPLPIKTIGSEPKYQ
jgi:hypothetical protein